MATIKEVLEAAKHQPLIDLLTNLLNFNSSNGGIAIGSTASKVKTANSVDYTIDGKYYTKAGTDDFWTLSGSVIPVSSFCKFALCIDAAGAASAVQGVVASTSAAALVPDPTANTCCLGYVEVATNGSTTFDPGTTLLSAAGITDVYVNIATVVSLDGF
jgi:hypothetical protein